MLPHKPVSEAESNKVPKQIWMLLGDHWKVTVKRPIKHKDHSPEGSQLLVRPPAVCDVGVPQPGSSGLGGGRAEGLFVPGVPQLLPADIPSR